MKKNELKKIIISSLKSSIKKELPVYISAIIQSKLKAKDINIATIYANAYCVTFQLKKTQVFFIFMIDIQYQAEKEVKDEKNLKSVIPQEYHNFFNVFLKKNSDILPSNQKYNHKIQLEEEQNFCGKSL